MIHASSARMNGREGTGLRNPTKPMLILVGPTASGKTALSLELARRAPGGGECIGADSMQVYRGMDIGTATPDRAERGSIPHHLLDVTDPHESGFTVHDWLALADEAVEGCRARGRLPIVVGGTNLYVRALLEGVFPGAPVPPETRERLESEGLESLYARLEEVDPAAAERIHRNDRRRIVRALEVWETTGTPISSQQTQWGEQRIASREDALVVCLDWAPDALNRRINHRVRRMMEAGFLEEVARLREEGPLGRQAAEAVGYQELADHLAGRSSLEEAVERIKIRSRRYGKQQRTWIRRFHAVEGVLRVECSEEQPPTEALEPILQRLASVTG